MTKAMLRRRRSVQMLKRRIDPQATVIGRVEMLCAALRAGEPGHARHAVLDLMRTTRDLNRLHLWKALDVPKSVTSQPLDSVLDQRREMLIEASDNFRSSHGERGDILVAVDAMHEVVASMLAMFVDGKVRPGQEPDSWEQERYMCAALLPALAEQLEIFWIKLRERKEKGA